MKYQHLQKSTRMEISILLNKGYSLRDISRTLEYNPSSISREINNNGGRDNYDPLKAQHNAYKKRRYSKYQGMKINEDIELQQYVETRIKDCWTPEEIAGKLKADNHDKSVISAKSIYKYLYSPYGQYLCNYLPLKRFKPRKRKKGKKGKRGSIKDRVFIDHRPDIVNERARFGDWEADTLGRPKTCSAQTLVGVIERKTRYLLAAKVSRLKYSMDGFKAVLNPYHETIKSLTLDNGRENASFKKLKLDIYFCHAYSSWEKGSIENSFGRLRRFIPKKADLKYYSDKQISDIIHIMNNTPRKCLGYRTPNEVFKEQLLLTKKKGCCT